MGRLESGGSTVMGSRKVRSFQSFQCRIWEIDEVLVYCRLPDIVWQAAPGTLREESTWCGYTAGTSLAFGRRDETGLCQSSSLIHARRRDKERERG